MSQTDELRTRQARDSQGAPMADGVARDLSEFARELEDQTDTDAVMHRIVTAAVDELDGASGAAITLVERGKVRSPVHSGEWARRLGLAQERTGQGPCVDTAREEITLRCDDLRRETRWPRWAAEAVRLGAGSALSFQLFTQGNSIGALDIYADKPRAFDTDSENIGLLLATHAAIAMSASRKTDNLRIALESRDVIGQAKGILMERYKVDAAEAFDLLITASQATHRKLNQVAEHLATTGEIPLPPTRR
jgi:GAF domain-containing protein